VSIVFLVQQTKDDMSLIVEPVLMILRRRGAQNISSSSCRLLDQNVDMPQCKLSTDIDLARVLVSVS